jgi:hypothetical protein
MKEQDHPEDISPRDNLPADDAPDLSLGASRSSSQQEKTTPALSQRLAEAFREGIASAKPDHDKPPEVRIPPPLQTSVQRDRHRSDSARTLDRVIQEGGSAASVLYDKAAEAVDSAVRLAKTAPAISTKWAQAFREGFASVRPREARERKERIPYSGNRQQSGDRGIMDRILQVGGSAAEVVRGAVASVQPGEARGPERKIRTAEKRIKDLYVEIGHEAVGSWSKGGPVVTEKLDELFDELRRNEEEIGNLKKNIAEAGAARSAEAVRSQQAAKEPVVTPASDKEEISLDAGVSGAKPHEQAYDAGNWQQPESPEGGDFTVTEMSVFAEPEAESPASSPAPEQAADAETAPLGKVSDEPDQALSEEPRVSQEKTEATEVLKKDE